MNLTHLRSTALGGLIGLAASLVFAGLGRIAALRTGATLPILPVALGGLAGGILGVWVARLTDRGAPSSTSAFLRIFFAVLALSVLTGLVGLLWLRESLFPGVPIQYSGVGILGWAVGVFAGGGWVGIQALIRKDHPEA
jgi:hypothetical protein